MAEPTIAQIGPYEVELEAGKIYKWCACGRSGTSRRRRAGSAEGISHG